MEQFVGECVGGPLDGKKLAHWARSKELFRPMMTMTFSDDPPIEAIKIGEYKLNDYNQWHWWATDEGRAFDKLFGPASG